MEKIFNDVGVEVKLLIKQNNNTADKIVTIIRGQSRSSIELTTLLSASTTFDLLPISLKCRKEIIEWCRSCLEDYDTL
jgi:hypothetical protein